MDITFIISSIAVFLGIILVLVVILLTAKRYLMPSGTVAITINDKEKLEVAQGSSLLSTLSENGVYLSSACGGKGSCGQCKVQVVEGGGEILDVEKGHFTRKEIKEGFRLGCQCKVKGDISIQVPEASAILKLGSNLAFSTSSAKIPSLLYAPTQWPTIRQKATALC